MLFLVRDWKYPRNIPYGEDKEGKCFPKKGDVASASYENAKIYFRSNS